MAQQMAQQMAQLQSGRRLDSSNRVPRPPERLILVDLPMAANYMPSHHFNHASQLHIKITNPFDGWE